MSCLLLSAWLFFWTDVFDSRISLTIPGIRWLSASPPSKKKKKKTPPTLTLVPSPPQPYPNVTIHRRLLPFLHESLCTGPAGSCGGTDTSLRKKCRASVHFSSYFFELNDLRVCKRFCGFPPNYFSISLAPKTSKMMLVQCKVFWLQGKKIIPASFELSPVRAALPHIAQAVHCSLIQMG